MATRNAAKLKAQPLPEPPSVLTQPDHRARPAHLAPLWQPGQSGNPAGRPRGARSKLSEKVIQALLDSFERDGVAVINEVRRKNPTAYLAACVSLLPKQQEKLDSPFSDLTEDELNLLEQFLKSTRAKTQPPIIEGEVTDAEPNSAAAASQPEQPTPEPSA